MRQKTAANQRFKPNQLRQKSDRPIKNKTYSFKINDLKHKAKTGMEIAY